MMTKEDIKGMSVLEAVYAMHFEKQDSQDSTEEVADHE